MTEFKGITTDFLFDKKRTSLLQGESYMGKTLDNGTKHLFLER